MMQVFGIIGYIVGLLSLFLIGQLAMRITEIDRVNPVQSHQISVLQGQERSLQLQINDLRKSTPSPGK